MTYTTSRQSLSRNRRECFGDDTEFNNGKHCRVCPDRRECEETILNSVNTQAIRSARTPMPTHRKYTTTSSPTTRTYTTTSGYYQQPKVVGANALLRPVKFNHARPLLPQYMRYVAFDTAEALAGRAGDLIRSAREEYERELLGGVDDADT